MKFAVFTVLHYDIIYDSERRLNELFDSFMKEAVFSHQSNDFMNRGTV